MQVKGLKHPGTLTINFTPSRKQLELWKLLQPNCCPHCGGEIEIKLSSYDQKGLPVYAPVCKKCGSDELPQIILGGGAGGGGKSYVGSCWIIINCLRFPDLKAVVARKTIKALKGSTFSTIKLVLRTWGLEEGVNYKINNLDGIVTFYNGSTISLIELEDLPSDVEFERLGSNEWSIGFVDECSQISEKAVEVLFSRLRWNIADTFIYPRLLLTTNPCMNWVRSRFVQDEEGNKVKCSKHDAYVQFTVYDNPNKQFVATYRASLDKISDVVTRNRILYGNWDFIASNEAAAYWNFDGNKHLITDLREKAYDPLKPLILSFDFNVAPYMSCLIAQMDYENHKVYVIEEVVGRPESKENNTPKFAEKIKSKLLEIGHVGGVVVTGDPAGMARSTTTEEGVNNYSIIMSVLDIPQLRPKKKLLSKQPAQKTRLEFVNSVLAGKEGWDILIDLRCRKLTEDLINQRKEMDGSKSKAKVMDSKLGIKYEKYGHFSDTLDYLLVLFLNEPWRKFNASGSSGITTFNGTPIYGSFEY